MNVTRKQVEYCFQQATQGRGERARFSQAYCVDRILELFAAAERPQLSAEQVRAVFCESLPTLGTSHAWDFWERKTELLNALLVPAEWPQKDSTGYNSLTDASSASVSAEARQGPVGKDTEPLDFGSPEEVLAGLDRINAHNAELAAAPPVTQAEPVESEYVSRAAKLFERIQVGYTMDDARMVAWEFAAIRREAERAARLDEAKWWAAGDHPWQRESQPYYSDDCKKCARIKDLERALADSPVSGEKP